MSYSALMFCNSVLERGHELNNIFFLAEGVLHADSTTVKTKAWIEWLADKEIQAQCCISSCQKYALADKKGKALPTFAAMFEVSGLGQQMVATEKADRLITFGEERC